MKRKVSLQHTRGASLRNVSLLCLGLQELGGVAPRRTLMLRGRDLGLPGFELVKSKGGLPTRVRHHEYALRELELIETEGSVCTLSTRGAQLAAVTQSCGVQTVAGGEEDPDTTLPEPVRAALRDALCASRYVAHWWLRYFMTTDEFSATQFARDGRDVIIEFLPTDKRVSVEGSEDGRFTDSGYRLHSYFNWRPTLALDESGRREVHEGLRQWSIRLELVGEITGWDAVLGVENQYSTKLESSASRLDRAYPVRRRWPADISLDEFEETLSKIRHELGNPRRVRMPHLVTYLAVQERFSLRAIRKLLQELYRQEGSHYFFEPASRWLLGQPGSTFPLESYVRIDGAWRTSLVFAEAHREPR